MNHKSQKKLSVWAGIFISFLTLTLSRGEGIEEEFKKYAVLAANFYEPQKSKKAECVGANLFELPHPNPLQRRGNREESKKMLF